MIKSFKIFENNNLINLKKNEFIKKLENVVGIDYISKYYEYLINKETENNPKKILIEILSENDSVVYANLNKKKLIKDIIEYYQINTNFVDINIFYLRTFILNYISYDEFITELNKPYNITENIKNDDSYIYSEIVYSLKYKLLYNIIVKLNYEKKLIEYAYTENLKNIDKKTILKNYHLEYILTKPKDKKIDILLRYIDDIDKLKENYFNIVKYSEKKEYFLESLFLYTDLIDYILSKDKELIIDIIYYFIHEGQIPRKINNTYYQSLFIDEVIKKYNNKNLILSILRYINEHNFINNKTKNKYDNYTWFIEADKYNI